MLPVHGRYSRQHVFGGVEARRYVVTAVSRTDLGDAVESECADLTSEMVTPRHVPAASMEDEPVRVERALTAAPIPCGVVNGDGAPLVGGFGEFKQDGCPGRNTYSAGRGEPCGGQQRAQAVRQRARQDALQLRHRAVGRGDLGGQQPGATAGSEAEHDRDRLVVGQHEWRELVATRQPVAAVAAATGLNRDAEVGKVLGVTAHGPLIDAETLSELTDRVLAASLQQPEQSEHARRGPGQDSPPIRSDVVRYQLYVDHMATYVLVPGFWLGAWAWRPVAQPLRERGHNVHPVSLTGMAERAGQARPDTDLETHINDVVNLLASRDLHDVILVGHSYAGLVITGAADRLPERIEQLVYLDTGPLPDGMSQNEFAPPEQQTTNAELVANYGDGWQLPPPPWATLAAPVPDVDEAAIEALTTNSVPQPWATATSPARLTGRWEKLPRLAILCTFTTEQVRAMAATVPAFRHMVGDIWRYAELPTWHWPMFSRPAELAEILDGVTR